MKKHFLIWGILVGIVVGMVENLWEGKGVWAMVKDEEGVKWYNTAELLEMAKSPDGENLLSQFEITGINVKENKLHILLQDKDPMGWMMRDEKTIFKEIGIMQYKCETDEECGVKFWQIVDYVAEGAPMNEISALYQVKNDTDEQIMVINEEFEVKLVELEDDELGLETGEFQAYMIGDNTNSVGGIVYHDCLESPEYEEGMWCKKMTSEMMNSKYVPEWEKVEEEIKNEDENIKTEIENNEEVETEKTEETEEAKNEEIEETKEDKPVEFKEEKVEETEKVIEEIEYATVVKDGGWEDESWENDDWEDDNWGDNDVIGDNEENTNLDDDWENFLGEENLDGLEDDLKTENINIIKMPENNREKYQWTVAIIMVISVAVAVFSFFFLILCQKSRKKSKKTLDNLENLI